MPGPRITAATAQAAPSQCRVSAKARVGVRLAAAPAWDPAGRCADAPPGLPKQAGPGDGDNSQRTAQGGGGPACQRRKRAGLSAPGLHLPRSGQCVAGPNPDNPHCLDRLR